jgi:hypothetical protein
MEEEAERKEKKRKGRKKEKQKENESWLKIKSSDYLEPAKSRPICSLYAKRQKRKWGNTYKENCSQEEDETTRRRWRRLRKLLSIQQSGLGFPPRDMHSHPIGHAHGRYHAAFE